MFFNLFRSAPPNFLCIRLKSRSTCVNARCIMYLLGFENFDFLRLVFSFHWAAHAELPEVGSTSIDVDPNLWSTDHVSIGDSVRCFVYVSNRKANVSSVGVCGVFCGYNYWVSLKNTVYIRMLRNLGFSMSITGNNLTIYDDLWFAKRLCQFFRHRSQCSQVRHGVPPADGGCRCCFGTFLKRIEEFWDYRQWYWFWLSAICLYKPLATFQATQPPSSPSHSIHSMLFHSFQSFPLWPCSSLQVEGNHLSKRLCWGELQWIRDWIIKRLMGCHEMSWYVRYNFMLGWKSARRSMKQHELRNINDKPKSKKLRSCGSCAAAAKDLAVDTFWRKTGHWCALKQCQ